MSRVGVNRLLLVALVVSVALVWLLRRDVSQPNFLFTPEMVHSVPYDAWTANALLAGGQTMQTPVPGTIARGQMPLHYAATPEDAARAAAELVNPWSVEPIDAEARTAAETRGRKLYTTFCLPCHGAAGAGDGPVSARGYPPPPSFGLDNALNMADGQMFHILTYGQKNMPGYAGQVAAEDRWKVILHVRALQVAFRQQIAEQKAKAEALALGQQLFEKLNCAKCHPVSETERPRGQFLGKVSQTYTREQLLEAILYPSKMIAAGFLAERFLRVDGTTFSGFVIAETAEEITILDSDGNEHRLLVDDIDERKALEQSPMPEGLIKDITDAEREALLDYLQSIPPASVPAAAPPAGAAETPPPNAAGRP